MIRAALRVIFVAMAGALAALPSLVQAQTEPRPPVVGFLGIASRESHVQDLDGLRQGLADQGYTIGQNILLKERYANGGMEQFALQLDDMVMQQVDVLVVPGLAAALAIRKRAPDMPVVAVGLPSTVTDPDLFESLNHPGGSVTGLSHFGEDLAAKRVDLLREVVPGLTTVAVLHNTVDPLFRAWGEKTEQAAHLQGLRTIRLGLTSPKKSELESLMRSAQTEGAEGLIIVRDFLTHTLQDDIVHAADVQHIATMAEQRNFVDAGGLMSYGASFPDLFRRAAAYVAQILKGAKPADMPIQLTTEFELVINLRTAANLGLAIPPAILLRAGEIIE